MPYLNRQTAISTLLCLTLILSACANSTVPLYEGDPRPIGNPTWITIQVISIEVLRAPGEVDRVNEFRFFLVAGNEDPAYAVGYVYPARNNMAVRVGDVIHTGGTYGLSIDENALDGELYVYMAGIDSDQQSRLVNFGTEAVISLVAEGLAIAVAGGNPAVSFITGYVLSALSDYVQEDDVIGDGLVVLRASERWSAGQIRSFTSDNGALRVTYRVTLSQPGAAEPVYARVVPEPYVQVDDFADPAAFDRNWWVNDPGGVCDLGVAGEELAFDCFNPAKKNWVATLHPRSDADGVTGVSATMWVKESQGAVKPVTNWRCDATGPEKSAPTTSSWAPIRPAPSNSIPSKAIAPSSSAASPSRPIARTCCRSSASRAASSSSSMASACRSTPCPTCPPAIPSPAGRSISTSGRTATPSPARSTRSASAPDPQPRPPSFVNP